MSACAHYVAVVRAAHDRESATIEGSITSAVLVASVVARLCQCRGGKDDDGDDDRGGETHIETWGWVKKI